MSSLQRALGLFDQPGKSVDTTLCCGKFVTNEGDRIKCDLCRRKIEMRVPASEKFPAQWYIANYGPISGFVECPKCADWVPIQERQPGAPCPRCRSITRAIVCPSCKEDVEPEDDQTYLPFHVACHFGE